MVGIILITKQYTVIPCATSPPPVLNKEVVKEHLSIFYFERSSLFAGDAANYSRLVYLFISESDQQQIQFLFFRILVDIIQYTWFQKISLANK